MEELENRLAPAQTFVWNGASLADSNWKTAANWVGNVAPSGSSASLDDLVFPASAARLSNNNNIIGAVFNSITFQGSGYTLSGSPLTLGDASIAGSGHVVANNGALGEKITFDVQMGGAGGSKQFFTINNGADLTVTGKLTGTTGVELTKDGLGTLTLSGDNSGFTGPITLDANCGILQITNANALGDASAGTTIGVGSQLQISNIVGGSVNETVTVNSAGFNNGAILNVAGNNTWAGGVQMDSDSTIGTAANTTLTISGTLSDLGGGHNFTKTGHGTLIFPGVNTYRGLTTINDGVLQIQASSTIISLNGVPTLVSGLGTGSSPLTAGTYVTSTWIAGVPFQVGTLQIKDPTATGTAPVNIINETIYLSGVGFAGQNGSFVNVSGFNTWNGNVRLEPPTAANGNQNVTINTLPGTTTAPSSLTISDYLTDDTPTAPTLTKVGAGTLVLTQQNSYRGATFINQGIVDIRDSGGLGFTGAPTTVSFGATLELEIDDQADSITGTTNTLNVSEPLTISGSGTTGQGALFSHTGINIYSADITASNATLGVDPDPNQTNGINYVLNDYSLTITSALNATTTLSKAGQGQLVLPNANPGINGPAKYVAWDIKAGWVTINDDHSLGATIGNTNQNNQPTITIENGGALHLKPTGTNNMMLTPNFNLDGMGITHKFVSTNTIGGIDAMGAIASLSGVNTLVGNIVLSGVVGIGVERVFPDVAGNPSLVGSPSQLYVTGNVSDGPAVSGGINKLGSKLLVMQGTGTYSGTVDIKQGVWLNENNTGFGVGVGAPPPLIHDYEFQGTLADSPLYGGPALVQQGGTVNANSFTWNRVNGGPALNEGLKLPAAAFPTPSNYTIEIVFSFNTVPPPNPTNYNRIIDYKGAVSDDGLYEFGTQLVSYPTGSAGPNGVFQAGVPLNLTITRNAATSTAVTYINGVQQYVFPDATNTFVLGSPFLNFFIDDSQVQDETSGGSITKLRIYNRPLTAGEVVFVNGGGVLGGGGSPMVEAGAALLLANHLPNQNSTFQGGENAFNGHLVLNGPGNTTLGPQYNLTGGPPIAPLTVVSDSTLAQLVHPSAPTWKNPALTLSNGGTQIVGQTYYYQVTAIVGGVETMPSIYQSATPIGANRTIVLNWNPVPGATGYNVYRSALPGAFAAPAFRATTVGNGATTYADSGGGTFGVAPPPADIITPTDTYWRGPITLNTSVAIDVQPGSRLNISGNIDDIANAGPTGSNLVKIDTGDLILGGTNSYRGTTYVGTSNTGTIYNPDIGGKLVNTFFNNVTPLVGTGSGGILTVASSQGLGGVGLGERQTLTMSAPLVGNFTLSFNGSTTGNLSLASGALASDIQGALNNLASIRDIGASVTVTNVGNVYTVNFSGNLAGYDVQTLVPGGPAAAKVTPATVFNGAGGTVVQNGAALLLQGNLTVAGEPLVVQGTGVSSIPATLPQTWANIGPGPIANGLTLGTGTNTNAPVSGRITGITTDPTDANTIYVSTNDGGVFKTTNNGKIWQPLFDVNSGIPMFTGSLVGVSGGANRNTYYLATGEANNSIDSFYGTGIYKTTDAGQTWTLVTGQETQTVNVSGTAGSFQLTFNGQQTPAGGLLFNDTAANVRTALGGLTSFGGITNVSVTRNDIKEIQQIWVNATGGKFFLSFNGSTAVASNAFNDTAANIQTTLNGLASIVAAGGVTVVKDGNSGDNNYLVTFNLPGTQPALISGASDPANALTPAGSFVQGIRQRLGGYSYDITFTGALAGAEQPLITAIAAGGASISATATMTSPFNPFMRKAISKVIVDPSNPTRLYVADGDLATYGTAAGDNTLTGPVGVWRFDGTSWFCLTDVVSDIRGGALPTTNSGFPVWKNTNGGPNFFPFTAGPNDNFFLSFPTTQATYSDVWMSPSTGTLYIALGTTQGTVNDWFTPAPDSVLYPNNPYGLVTREYPNAVYRITNPASVNANTTKPVWSIGDGDPGGTYSNGGGSTFPSGFTATFTGNQFSGSPPSTGTPVNGNIKISGFYNGTNDIVYGAIAMPGSQLGLQAVERTGNNGAAWAAVTPGAPLNLYMGGGGGISGAGSYDNAIAVSNSGVVYVGGQTGYLSSNTNGASWTNITVDATGAAPHSAAHAMFFDPTGNLLVGTDGGIWRFNVANSTWSNLNGTGLNITAFNSVGGAPSAPGGIFGGSSTNGLDQYSGTQSWSAVSNNLNYFNNVTAVRVDPNNSQIVYQLSPVLNNQSALWNPGAGPYPVGVLSKSTTGGAAGSFSFFNGFTLFQHVVDFAIDQVNSNRIVVTTDGDMLESLDGGNNWTELLLQGGTTIGVAAYQGKFQPDSGFSAVVDKGSNSYDPDTIYQARNASAGTIVVTKNHGVTFQTRSLPAGSTSNISNLIVDPRSRDTIYVVRNVFSGSRVFKSTDAGQTWIDLTGVGANALPDSPVWKIILDPRNGDLYVGTDQGVYKSANGDSKTAATVAWTRFGTGLPNVQVRDLYIDQTQNTLTVATYGRGMFQIWLNNAQPNVGALDVASGSVVWTGPIALAANTLVRIEGNQAFLQNGVAAAKFNILGSVRDLAPTSGNLLTKDGGGFLVLSGSNTYAGVTQILNGVVIANNPDALGGPAGNTVVNAGTALWIENDLELEPVSVTGDGIPFGDHNTGAIRNISNNNTYTGTITLNTDTTIGADSGTSLIVGTKLGLLGTGTITGAHNLVKELTGSLILAGSDTYGGAPFTLSVAGSGGIPVTTWPGGTLVSQGVLNIQNNNALGVAGNTVTVLNGAQLQMQGNITVDNTQTMRISGTGIGNTGALENVGGSNHWQGSVILSKDASFNPAVAAPTIVDIGALLLDTLDLLTIDGKVTDGVNTYGITKVGPGTVILNNNTNDYDGVTTVATGILRTEQNKALGAAGGGAGPAAVVIAPSNNAGNGWAGLTFAQSSGGYVPPDTNGAAGPTNYVETVNQTIAIFNPKATGAGSITSSFANFWYTVGGLAKASATSFLSDPIVCYDELIGRFIVGDQDVEDVSSNKSIFHIAVSKTSSPADLTAANWYFYNISTTEDLGSGTRNGYVGAADNFDADYPGNFGYNADAFVFTLNMFNTGGGSFHTMVTSVDASDLAAGVPQASLRSYQNDVMSGSLRPTTMHGSVTGDPMWLLNEGGGNSINVRKMTNVLSNSATFTNFNVSVNAYAAVVAPRDPGGIITNNIDSRIMKAAEANNTIVASHAISLSATQDVARWYSFDVSSGIPALSDQGNVSAGNNTYLVYPSVDINPAGNIGMTYAQSGTAAGGFMSAWITGRAPTDAAGTMETPVMIPAGAGTANNTDGREGDMSGINIDPVNGSFWAINEFTNAAGWSQAVANFTVGPTGPPPSNTIVQTGAALEIDSVPAAGGALTVTNEGLVLNGSGTSEVQTLKIVGAAGVFTLTFTNPLGVVKTTGNLNVNATAAQVQNALNLLTNISGYLSGGSVSVVKSGSTFLITFGGSLAGTNVAQLVSSDLTVATVGTFRDGGTGALRNISGNNTWAGASGNVTLQTDTLIGVDPTTNLTITSPVQDLNPATVPSPDLRKVGLGTLHFPNANPYTGATLVNEGILAIQNAGALGSVVNEIQTVTLGGPLTGAFTLTFKNTNGVSSTTGSLSADYTVTNPTFIADIQAALNGLNSVTSVGGSVVVATVAGFPSSFSVTFSGGSFAGKDQNQMTGAGLLGASIAIATTQDGSQGTTVAAGATLQLQGIGTESTEYLTLNGTGFNNAGALESFSGSNTWHVPITLGSDASIGVDTGAPLTVDVPITDNGGGFGLTKTGNDTLIFTGTNSNTYTGLTTVSDGTLLLNKSAPFKAIQGDLTVGDGANAAALVKFNTGSANNQIAAASSVIVNSDGTLDLNQHAQSVKDLTINTGLVTTDAGNLGAGALNVTGPLGVTINGGTLATQGAGSQVIVTNDVNAVGGAITTPGANSQVAVNGDYTETDTAITESGANTQVTIVGLTNLTGGGATLAGAGSKLNLRDVTATSDANPATISGPGTVVLGAGNRNFTINAGLRPSDLVINSTMTGNGGITKNGAGRLELGGANAYGLTTISGGDVQVDVGASIGDVAVSGSLATPASLSGGSGASVGTVGKITPSASFTATLTGFFAGDSFKLTYSNGVQNGTTTSISYSINPATTANNIRNALAVLQASLGIGGAVSVSGAAGDVYTIVYTGALAVNAKATTGAADAGSSGIINVSVNLVNVINPGHQGAPAGTGTLAATGDVTFTRETTFAVDLSNASASHPTPIAGADYDQLIVNGNVDLGNALLTGNITGPNIQLFDTFTILTTTGTGTINPSSHFDRIAGTTRVPILDGDPVFINGTKFTLNQTTTSVVLTRNQVSSTVAITSSVQPASVYGRAVTFTATVTPEPNGILPASGVTVTFTVDKGTPAEHITAPIALNASGQATFDPQALFGTWSVPTTHTIDADFNDATGAFAPESAPQFTQIVNLNGVTMAVSSSPIINSSGPVYGQNVTLTAILTPIVFPVTPLALVPDNLVQFELDGGGLNTLTAAVHHNIILSNFVAGDQFTLTYNGNTTGAITYSSVGATMASNIQALLNLPAILGVGNTASVTWTGAPNMFRVAFGAGLRTGQTMTGASLGLSVGNVNANVLTAAVTFPSNLLTGGGHTVVATYFGDSNYAGSGTSPSGAPTSFAMTIQKDNSAIAITPPASTTLGQPAGFQIQVTPVLAGSTGIPQGIVKLFDASSSNPVLDSHALDATGKWTLSTSNLALGLHTVVVTYTATDGNYKNSSQTVSFTVNKAPTATTFVSETPSSPLYGQPVTFVVKVDPAPAVNPALGVPGGTVTLWDGLPITGTNLGSGPVNIVTGQATILVSGTLSAAGHTINAVYSGNSNFVTSTGTLASFTVGPATTTTTLVASPSGGSIFGQSVTFTATVTSPTGTPPVNSTVTFVDTTTNTLLGSQVLNGVGVATLSTTVLTVATHTITATYHDSIDANFADSVTTPPLTGFVVTPANTNTVLSASPASGAVYGQGVTFTATVTSPTGPPPSVGSVSFVDLTTSTFLGTINLSAGGIASVTTGLLTVATHSIQATYTDAVDANYNGSSDTLNGYTVAKASTITTLVVTPTGGDIFGQTITLTATVTSPTATPPLGAGSTVTFFDLTTSTTLGSANLGLGGTASITTNVLTGGIHAIRAVYTDTVDGNFLGSSDTLPSYLVSKAATTTTLAANPPTGDVYGQAATFTATVTSPAGAPPVGSTVYFYDGFTNLLLGFDTIDAAGHAVLTTSTLSATTHQIKASYVNNIDTNFADSNGTLNGYVVAPVATTITVTADPASGAVVSQAVALTATVTAAVGIPPAGSNVVFKDDQNHTLGGGATDAAGKVTILTFNLAAGTRTITASFHDLADTNYADSVGTLNNYLIAPSPTVTVVSATPGGGAVYGQTVSLQATVTGNFAHPPFAAGSTVTFYADSTANPPLGSADLIVGGIATINTTALAMGTHTIIAVYADNADNNFTGSTGTLIGYSIGKAVTSITLSANPIAGDVFGRTVTFTAKVKSPTATPPTGPGSTVTFVDATTNQTLGVVNLIAGGTASINTDVLTAGSHTITATYVDTADNNFVGSTNSLIGYAVGAANTIVTSFSSSAPSGIGAGQSITFTATAVTLAPSAAVIDAGTITFVNSTTGTVLGSGTVNATGTASFTATLSTVGTNVITAAYNGNLPRFNASAAESLNQKVLKGAVVNVAPVANVFGQNLVYTVTVTSPQGGVPTGTVTLAEGAVALGNVGILANIGGVATSTITVPGGVLNATNHNLVFTYDDTSATPLNGSNVKSISQTIAAANTTVTFAPTPQASAPYGASVTYSGSVKTAATGGINPTSGTVTLKDNNTGATLGTFNLSGSNAFAFTNVPLPLNMNVGTHTISAAFVPANSDFVASPARTSTLSVAQALTQVSAPISSVTSSPLGGSYFGEQVQFTVNVISTNSPATVPTGGTVSFFLNGTTLLGVGNLVNGVASYLTNATQLPVNATTGDRITAVYKSSNPASPTTANFKLSAASPAYFQKVSKAATAVDVSSSLPGGSAFGQAVTFMATVSIASPGAPGKPTTTGATVKFFDGVHLLGAGTLLSTTATTVTYRFTTAALSASGSPHAITATYSGAGNFAAGTSAPALAHVVNPAGTTTALTASPLSWASDTATTFTATVSLVAGAGSLTAGATVVFTDGLATLGTGTLIGSTATTATYRFIAPANSLAIGLHTITAVYSGNANITGSFSASQTQFVHKFTKLVVTALNPIAGVPTTITLTFTGVGGARIPDSSLTVTINGSPVNVTTDANGVATLSYTFANIGPSAVTASFATDGIYNDVTTTLNTMVKPKVTGRLV